MPWPPAQLASLPSSLYSTPRRSLSGTYLCRATRRPAAAYHSRERRARLGNHSQEPSYRAAEDSARSANQSARSPSVSSLAQIPGPANQPTSTDRPRSPAHSPSLAQLHTNPIAASTTARAARTHARSLTWLTYHLPISPDHETTNSPPSSRYDLLPQHTAYRALFLLAAQFICHPLLSSSPSPPRIPRAHSPPDLNLLSPCGGRRNNITPVFFPPKIHPHTTQ